MLRNFAAKSGFKRHAIFANEGRQRLRVEPMDVLLIDPQYTPAMLFDDKAELPCRPPLTAPRSTRFGAGKHPHASGARLEPYKYRPL